MKQSIRLRDTRRLRDTKRLRATRRKQRGGFRYGNKTRRTPIPGEILISSPKTKTKTRTNTNKKNSWF